MKTISLAMIIKNEEKNLPNALNSVKNEVDEIIIVDSGSTDKSIEIAKSFGAKIIETTWNNSFSELRNLALKNSTKDWILYLDADEILTTKNLKSFIPKNDKIGALKCQVIGNHLQPNNKVEKHAMSFPRFFVNDSRLMFYGRVHEAILPSLMQCNFEVEQSEISILHSGYDCSENEMKNKALRNYELLKQDIYDNPTNSFAFYSLAQVLLVLKCYKQARRAIEMSIKLNNMTDEIKSSIYVVYARLLYFYKEFDKAIYWCNESLTLAPKQFNANMVKSECYFQLGNKLHAMAILENLLELSKTKFVSNTGYDVLLSTKQIEEIIKKVNPE